MKITILAVILIILSPMVYCNENDEQIDDSFSSFGVTYNRYSMNLGSSGQNGNLYFNNMGVGLTGYSEETNFFGFLNVAFSESMVLSAGSYHEKINMADTDYFGLYLQSNNGWGFTLSESKSSKLMGSIGANLSTLFLFNNEEATTSIQTLGIGISLINIFELKYSYSAYSVALINFGYDLIMISGDLINQAAYAGGINISLNVGYGSRAKK
jgi:hypothetical protein